MAVEMFYKACFEGATSVALQIILVIHTVYMY